MEISTNNLNCCVKNLLHILKSKKYDEHRLTQLQTILNIHPLNLINVQQLFEVIGETLLKYDDLIPHVALTFQQYLLLIVTTTETWTNVNTSYSRKCEVLTKLMMGSPEIASYMKIFFTQNPSPFESYKYFTKPQNLNKNRNNTTETCNNNSLPLSVMKTCYRLLVNDPYYYINLWNWSNVIAHCQQVPQQKDIRNIYADNIMGILVNYSHSKYTFINNGNAAAAIEFQRNEYNKLNAAGDLKYQPDICNDKVISMNIRVPHLVSVEGVILPMFKPKIIKSCVKNDENFVLVNSTKINLRSIALAIASDKAICLSGPVGCGKTTLIEYLALKTGRIIRDNKSQMNNPLISNDVNKKNPSIRARKHTKDNVNEEVPINIVETKPNGFLRIQLGDQTDSKMLLGQYRCTDMPSEFVWTPGVLTQAVMNGLWLLLEDFDTATPDTYMIISNLLENKYLSVPGFRDFIKIETGFQLFVTVRTKKSTNTLHKSYYSLMEKHLHTVNVLPLSCNELCKVIRLNYPKLKTVANRIVDIFLTFSSGDHRNALVSLYQHEISDKSDLMESYVPLPCDNVISTSNVSSGRLVSTRDLIKLCQRSHPMFDVTNMECAYFVFQNAVDIFCSHLPKSVYKTQLITSIGAKLGIIQSRCEYLSNEYKLDVKETLDTIEIGRGKLSTKIVNSDNVNDVVDAKRRKVNDENEYKNDNKNDNRNDNELLPPTNIISTKKLKTTFSFTRISCCILERIAVCISQGEPILLVGETGVGKTSAVQFLAERTQHKLIVLNMNNQSDVSDLIGGFKPVELSYIIGPLREEFEAIFRKTYNVMQNAGFLNKLSTYYNQGHYQVIINSIEAIVKNFFFKLEKKKLNPIQLSHCAIWHKIGIKVSKIKDKLNKDISFAFITGSLVNCLQNGDWVLLDEINLASAETLECLSTILEPNGSIVLLEKGDFTEVKRHPEFRIFACMNPSTDIGKKDLPVGIRNRFTEFFVDEVSSNADLSLIVTDYLRRTGIQTKIVTNIVKLYKNLKDLSALTLNDGLGNRPVFSLRTLCRALRTCAKNLCGSIERNLYESFCMSFLTQLDPMSHRLVLQLIKDSLLSNINAILKQGIPKPKDGEYINFEGYWIEQGHQPIEECSNYILTNSVKENLKDLARIISIGKLPILLQGPTSAGKTSLIEYVAKRSGNHCLRINNHEHTDLQEYIGTYMADTTGKLSFKEGVLVQAMRQGFWIILDELNLASTDILEALNRVLDDNRELFITETQTLVKAHPNFMLFATQNPPGLYGGRKTLSRAFKNRFIELHFSEIPRNELKIILEKRCMIPPSYANKMVMCMSDLQKNRKTTTKNVFTLRDLFRWGNRYTYANKRLLEDPKYDWNQHLVEEGYLVLSSKVRTEIEIEIIEETLYRNFKKRIDVGKLFDIRKSENDISPVTKDIINSIKTFPDRSDIVWTVNLTRIAVLTAKALQFNEPVLLVGPTGCGKTTVCQILASIHEVNLRILNCHMHTEGADFLGGLRPCRETVDFESMDSPRSKKLFEWSDGPLIYAMREGSYFMADEISLAEDSVLERLNCILEPERKVLLAEKGGVEEINYNAMEVNGDGDTSSNASQDLIVQASNGFQFLATMNPGGDFGKKELSPALRNRFTEIWCHPSDTKEDLTFIVIKNLTTIPEINEINKIAEYIVDIVFYIRQVVPKFKFSIRDILTWANYFSHNTTLSVEERIIFGLETIFLDSLEMLTNDSLENVNLLKLNILRFAVAQSKVIMGREFSLADVERKRGATVVYENSMFGIQPFVMPIIQEISDVKHNNNNIIFEVPTTKRNLFRLMSALTLNKPILLEGPPGVGKTSIVEELAGSLGMQTVRINLCEHTDLGDLFGTDLPAEDNILEKNRIESNQEMDEEIEMNKFGKFVWRDGPLLSALKSNCHWILLDELNLAPQSVLEGLNAILDHRGEVYIPELNKTFKLNNNVRIFACQNPLKQGGGRKGLPQSFLNRFNKVYLSKLSTTDMLYVLTVKYEALKQTLEAEFLSILQYLSAKSTSVFELYRDRSELLEDCDNKSSIILDLFERMVKFSERIDESISNMEFGYRGGPFEVNLRDLQRWCNLMYNPMTSYKFKYKYLLPHSPKEVFERNFSDFLLVLYERMKLVYYQRMRCEQDKTFIRKVFSEVFLCDADYLNDLSEDVSFYWTDDSIYLNDIVISRYDNQKLRIIKSMMESPIVLSSQRELLKNIIECLHMETPIILCGPTDSGKTKSIDTICTMINEVCNTDNIDDCVTGSFQQLDLNRHLEDIVKLVEPLTKTHVLYNFSKELNLKVVLESMKEWHEYYSLTRNSTFETMETTNANGFTGGSNLTSNEAELLGNRTRILIRILKRMHLSKAFNTSQTNILLKSIDDLNLLQNHIDKLDNLHMGGAFEWVDSNIVKSLRRGQFIKLEHVNLCSSAVLDRLNPIFEPNGYLAMSEKGATLTKNVEIIYKTQSFQPFLTVDPKNGELSRAMRNRCYELYLTKSIDDIDDLRMLIYKQGVHDIISINCIIHVHQLMLQLIQLNNFNLSNILKYAQLVASYGRMGYTKKRALFESGIEVYIYSSNIDFSVYSLEFYQNQLHEVVNEKSKALNAKIRDNNGSREDHLKNLILYSSQLNEFDKIRLEAEPIAVILNCGSDLKNALSSLWRKFEDYDVSNTDIDEILKIIIYLLYEVSTKSDINFRHQYIISLLNGHEKLIKLSLNLRNIVNGYDIDLKNTQIPWNPRMFPRLHVHNNLSESSINQKGFILSGLLSLKTFVDELPTVFVHNLKNASILAYSQAVENKTLVDKYNNDFLKYFSRFMKSLHNTMLSLFKNSEFRVKTFGKCLKAFAWYNRTLTMSMGRVTLQSVNQLNKANLNKLILHFYWMDKYLINILKEVLPNFNKLNDNFADNYRKLKEHLVTNEDDSLTKIAKLFTKHIIEFQPYYNLEQISRHKLLKKLDDILCVVPKYGSYSADVLSQKYSMKGNKQINSIWNRIGPLEMDYNFTYMDSSDQLDDSFDAEELKQAILEFSENISRNVSSMECDVEESGISLDGLDVELNKLSDVIKGNGDNYFDSTGTMKNIDICLIPLREYYFTKAIIKILTTFSQEDINVHYSDDDNLQNNSREVIKLLGTCKFQNYKKVWHKLVDHLDQCSSENEFLAMMNFLGLNYKKFASFHRLIENYTYTQQLQNLATRSRCTQFGDNPNDIDSEYIYEGPSLVNAMAILIFKHNGQLKTVPLNELDKWQSILEECRQLIWHNQIILAPSFNNLLNNYLNAQVNAKRLVHEITYVTDLCKRDNEHFSENFLKDMLANLSTELNVEINLNADYGDSLEWQQMQFQTAIINAYSGALEIQMMSFMPLIDPVEKKELQKRYNTADIFHLNHILTAYEIFRVNLKYRHFGDEIVEEFKNILSETEKTLQKCSHQLALRPEKCLYLKLVNEVSHFFKTNCFHENLTSLIVNSQTVMKALMSKKSISSTAIEDCNQLINKIELWINNSSHFDHLLEKYNGYYQDIVQPLKCSIGLYRFGLEGLKCVLTQVKASVLKQNINEKNRVHNVLSNIVSYPNFKRLEVFNVNSNREMMKNTATIFTVLNEITDSDREYFRLLKAKIMELRNLVIISANIDESIFKEFHFAFSFCNQIWHKEEDRRREQKAKDDSLYINKTKCEAEDEELIELEEIAEHFPTNVQEDFGEFIAEDTLEKVMKFNEKKRDLKKQFNGIVQEADYAFLVQNFIYIMNLYSSSMKKQNKSMEMIKDNPLEFIASFKDRMQTFVKLYEQHKLCLSECFDRTINNSFLFAVGLQQQSLMDTSSAIDLNGIKSTYNFYKDSNIPEIIGCEALLNRINDQILIQLNLYPEHASLIDIKRVIERIRTLPVTSPVVRFNTGFQILRQKVAQWNEVAHRNNHLREEEIEIANYVQKWMKLELQHWRNCLSETINLVESKAYKYWFFIYNLLMEYLEDQKVDNSYTDMKYAEKRFGDGEILDSNEINTTTTVSIEDVVRILREFIESSSYGDFHVRMQLLKAFELYVHNMEYKLEDVHLESDRKEKLIAGLYNLQVFFEQFRLEIDETKKTIRKPIEKKLKELVKIESYNKDLSFFSMRNNVARVHRNLNKFLKEYQVALQQKISSILAPRETTNKDYNFGLEKSKKNIYYSIDVKHFIASLQLRNELIPDAMNEEEDEEKEGHSLSSRVGKLFTISRNVVRQTLLNTSYPSLIEALDFKFREQLETCEYLRNLQVDRSKERPKQVLEAKQILQQKRKGLTDVFKLLTQLGLNFKTGLMELSLGNKFDDVLLPPFCISTMLQNTTKNVQTMKGIHQLNENLNNYYAKCVLKLKQLQGIMLKPLSELGPPNIDRIKGFAIDLFLLVQKQRRLLGNTTQKMDTFAKAVQNLKDLASICTGTNIKLEDFEFSESRKRFLLLKDSFIYMRFVLEQYKLFWLCVPEEQSTKNNILIENNSPELTQLTPRCDSILQAIKTNISNMIDGDVDFIDPKKLSSHEQAHSQVVNQINDLLDCLRASKSKELLPAGQPLKELLDYLQERVKNVDEEKSNPEIDFNEVDMYTELENILHSLLLPLQNLYKKYITISSEQPSSKIAKTSETPKISVDKDDEEEFAELKEHHLKKQLYKELKADVALLTINSVTDKLNKILLNIKLTNGSDKKCNYVRKLITILPMLEQYSLLADFYLLQQLGAHRVSAKMLSVLLTVFVEISMKGFCVPPDLMQDEEDKGKQQDQKEGEGFGLEDGTGEKDASDKLESEDQLDDAKRPEDRKDEGDKEQEDCKEEKGIEMSDNFDGEMQDIEKPENEEDDSGESEDEEDMNKEMGETEEGADKLDDQIWGDDEEQPEEEEKDLDEEDDGKGNKDEKDSHNDLNAKNDPSKNDENDQDVDDGLDATDEPSSEDKRKQKEKDIDNMKDGEPDEEQINPYHNELEEPPEPEDMDLGDMNNMNGDDQDDAEDQNGDENPFDIDKMKENMDIPEDAEADNEDEAVDDKAQNEEMDSDDSDADADDTNTEQKEDKTNEPIDENMKEADAEKEDEQGPSTAMDVDEDEKDSKEENPEKTDEEDPTKENETDQFENSTNKANKEENVESVPENNDKGSADQVQNDKDVKQDQKLDEQETGEEKDGVGQADNDIDDGGHQGVAETKETITPENRENNKRTREKRKQGAANEDRTLGEAKKPKLKQLKTIDNVNDSKDNEPEEGEEKDIESEEYQHVKEAKPNDKTTLDNATEEQSKKMQHLEDEEKKMDDEELDAEGNDNLEELDDNKDKDENIDKIDADKVEQKSDKPSKSEKVREENDLTERLDIEGEDVPTMTVPRNDDTTAHCIKELLLDNLTQATEPTTAETLALRKMYHEKVLANKPMPQIIENNEIWQTISSRMVHNARELCEQLRLILEPTKCTRLKGDYRTGRRINMKKIIPFIASEFRKDKIWLRRTKPAQRDYKITIAIDDSKSMHHNNSKTLTLEAISLVSQALTLLESGRLSIVSFGETPDIVMKDSEQFDGARLVGALNFEQNKTRIAELLDFIRIANVEEGASGSENGLFENLLLIMSDGRNIFSEGKVKVQNAVKLARMQRIFLVYIIIDNPENKNSILDIQSMEILPDKTVNINSYLDDFPFPYYVIVRDLNQLPLVLSEAMRQWFELVNSEQ